MLPLGEISEDLLLHRRKSRRSGDKPCVSLFQALQGVVGLPSGIRSRAHAGGVVAALLL